MSSIGSSFTLVVMSQLGSYSSFFVWPMPLPPNIWSQGRDRSYKLTAPLNKLGNTRHQDIWPLLIESMPEPKKSWKSTQSKWRAVHFRNTLYSLVSFLHVEFACTLPNFRIWCSSHSTRVIFHTRLLQLWPVSIHYILRSYVLGKMRGAWMDGWKHGWMDGWMVCFRVFDYCRATGNAFQQIYEITVIPGFSFSPFRISLAHNLLHPCQACEEGEEKIALTIQHTSLPSYFDAYVRTTMWGPYSRFLRTRPIRPRNQVWMASLNSNSNSFLSMTLELKLLQLVHLDGRQSSNFGRPRAHPHTHILDD